MVCAGVEGEAVKLGQWVCHDWREIDCAEIRMRAERRLGELIRAQKETVGLGGSTNGNTTAIF